MAMPHPAHDPSPCPASRPEESSEPAATRAYDSEILQACIAGVPEAWAWFVDLVSPAIWRVVWRFAANDNRAFSAEDMFQEVFVRLYADDRRILRCFDPARGSLEFYVALVARSTAIDLLRKHRHTPPLMSLQEFDPYDSLLPAPDNGHEPMIETWQIDAAMSRLGKREREVIRMSYQNESPTPLIAGKLGIAEATIRSTRRNALDKIRTFLRIS